MLSPIQNFNTAGHRVSILPPSFSLFSCIFKKIFEMIDSQQIGETAQKCPMHPSSSFPQWWHLTSHHSQKSDTGPMCVQFSALLNTRVAWREDHCNRITAYSITTKISLCSQAHTPTTPNPGHPVVCSPSLQCWHAENDIEVESRSP